MTASPPVVVFDVNETLSDMAPMAERFADVGAPRDAARLWFALVLRDGFALAAAGAAERFSVIAEGALRSALAGAALDRPLGAAIDHVMDGFSRLALHPDAVHGVRALAATGRRLVAFSNGAAAVAERLLEGARLRACFEACLSVEDAGTWKPARAAYRFAAGACAVAPADMLMVAVHPWDIDGAARAGLRTAWIDRGGRGVYPAHFTAPEIVASGIDALAERLTGPRP